MIKALKVTGLFGRFTYSIECKPDGITIITGPNGFGKSTILKIIDSLSRVDIAFFLQLEFKEIVVTYDTHQTTTILKTVKGIKIDDLEIPLSDEMMEKFEYAKRGPWIIKTASGYKDRRTDEVISEDDLFTHFLLSYADMGYMSSKTQKGSRVSSKSLHSKTKWIQQRCGAVRIISDQRLIKKRHGRSEEQRVIEVIAELPQRLKERISLVYNEYSDIANSLDSTYPNRLFAAKDGIADQEEYERCLSDANKKFEKLCQYKLVDMSMIDKQEYNSYYATALKIYFDDFAQKYTVFEGLITKLDLFTRIINNRLMFKRIEVSREHGFRIVDIDNPKKVISLAQLSSGEKQEIVLFYDLIFETTENLLLLIDEPEISLHITWQKKFLDDLLEVSKHTSIQVIVATHSPQIVSNHMDIQIDLGELYGEQLNNK